MTATGRHWVFGSLCAAFAAFSAYVYTAGTETPEQPPPGRQAMLGRKLFQESNCIACHQVYGLGGYLGPDLTNVVSAPGKGADYARTFIRYGTSRMPDFDLNEGQVDALVSFLEFVDATGTYPPRQPEISWNGTVDYGGGRD